MDPDANLKEQKELIKKIAKKEDDAHDRSRLRELQSALREWRSRGGFPPKDGWS